MAKYVTQSIPAKSLSALATALTAITDKVSVDTSGTEMIISMWDKITVTYSDKNSTDGASFTINIDGTDVTSGTSKLWYGETLEVIDGDDILWVKFGSTQMLDVFHVVEIKDGSDIYAGYDIKGSVLTSTINDLSFTKVGSEYSSLAVPKLFSYAAYPGTLDYSDYSVFTGASGRVGATTVFKSCSNVTYLSSVSIGDKNYMAIGTNNILEMDPISL